MPQSSNLYVRFEVCAFPFIPSVLIYVISMSDPAGGILPNSLFPKNTDNPTLTDDFTIKHSELSVPSSAGIS